MTFSHKFHPYVAFWEKEKKKFFRKKKKVREEMSKLTHSYTDVYGLIKVACGFPKYTLQPCS